MAKKRYAFLAISPKREPELLSQTSESQGSGELGGEGMRYQVPCEVADTPPGPQLEPHSGNRSNSTAIAQEALRTSRGDSLKRSPALTVRDLTQQMCLESSTRRVSRGAAFDERLFCRSSGSVAGCAWGPEARHSSGTSSLPTSSRASSPKLTLPGCL